MFGELFAAFGVDTFDPGEAIATQTALHGMLICVGVIEPDAKISGRDALVLANKYIKERIGHLEGEEE